MVKDEGNANRGWWTNYSVRVYREAQVERKEVIST